MVESFGERYVGPLLSTPAVPLVLIVVGVVTYFVYRRLKLPDDDDWTSELSKSKKALSSSSSGPLKNIWEERRLNGTYGNSAGTRKTDKDGKPFGSSYYYAHNNPNATGGYKDGLGLEDYQMETPRLLSKNGVPVSADTTTTTTTTPAKPTPAPPRKQQAAVPKETRIPISKYLWDDEGNAEGEAVIRIDSLPGKGSSSSISWKEANVLNVTANLINDGLLVTVDTEEAKYKLHLPKLYGQVKSVRPVSKTKRLLIRITKKRTWDKKNLEAWPHP